MKPWPRGAAFSRNWKARRESQLRRLANMRDAKERRRLARGPVAPEPRRTRWPRFEFGVRDKLTGEEAWHDLQSVRHASTALRLVLRYCQ